MTTNSTDSIMPPPLMSLPRSLLSCALLLLKRLSHTTMSTAMCKRHVVHLGAGREPDMQRVIDYVNTSANYAYTVRDEGWVGDPPFGSYEESYADVHPVTGEAREMTDPPFVVEKEPLLPVLEHTPPFVRYHLDTCDIGHCTPGCPCTHVKIGKEERSPWARPIEKEKVMETNEDNSPQSVAWSEVSRALECLSIDTARAIRVEIDQQYVFVTTFARHENGQILSSGRNQVITKTVRYEIDLAR